MTTNLHLTKPDTDSTVDCTIIIPTKDRIDYLKPCIDSLLASHYTGTFEILIVNNNSTEKKTISYLESLLGDARFRVVYWHKQFNFSEINNHAAKIANGEVLCFLNNDTNLITKNWLAELIPIARRLDVGAVGALLLYPDGRIQHGGIALDCDWVAKHIANGEPEDFFKHQNVNSFVSVDAITGACLFTRKDLFLRLDGFDATNLAISFNDVDYCLRLQNIGLPILLASHVKLIHYESVSRQSDDLPANQPRARVEKAFMQSKWRSRLKSSSYKNGLPDYIDSFTPDSNSEFANDQFAEFLENIRIGTHSEIASIKEEPSSLIRSGNSNQDELTNWEKRFRDLEIDYLVLENLYTSNKSSLNGIINSRFWRWTSPLRALLRALVKIKQFFGRSLMHYNFGRRLLALRKRNHPAAPIETKLETGDYKADYDQSTFKLFDKFLSENRTLSFPKAVKPQVSIILVFFNKAHLSFLCLESILEHAGLNCEVVIVDNASSDSTSELLSKLENVILIRNSENLGFVTAVNQGAKLANGKKLLLLNNDAVLEADAIENALATLMSSDEIGAVGGKILLLDGSLQEAGSIIWNDGSCLGYGRGAFSNDPEYMFRREVDYCSGAFLLFDKSMFLEMGGFDEDYAPAYYEESDFCIRLWKAGKKVIYEPTAQIRHYEFASSGGITGASKLQAQHRQVLCNKHADFLAAKLAPDPANIIRARSNNGRNINVLFIDDRVPHANLGSGYPRCAEFVHEISELNVNLTFYPLQNSFDEWENTYGSLPKNVEVILYRGREWLKAFLESRMNFYDFIVVSRVHNMEYFKKLTQSDPGLISGCRVIYDAEAISATREIMRLELTGTPLSAHKKSEMIMNEISFAENVHKTIAVSKAEAELYKKHGLKNISILGHTMLPSPTPARFAERNDILFVGALRDDNSPNVDSLLWFAEQVFPMLNAMLEKPIALLVVGDSTAPSLRRIRSGNIKFLGKLDDVRDLYNRCRVFIAPTRFAAGIPRKVHEAAAFGVPSVVTNLLAQQLTWQDGEELLAADSPDIFAAQCHRLYSDEHLWSHVREKALRAIETDCSPQEFSRQIAKLFD